MADFLEELFGIVFRVFGAATSLAFICVMIHICSCVGEFLLVWLDEDKDQPHE